MYPSLTVRYVEEPKTLRELVREMGDDCLYALERGALGVVVNGERPPLSVRLKRGDKVVVFPAVSGG